MPSGVHNNHCKGANHYCWNGGKRTDAKGHIWVQCPGHPRADIHGYVAKHILDAEQAMGKPLNLPHVVHHHTPDQLVICEDQAYHLFLHQRTRAYKACGHANWLRCKYCKQYDAPENLNTEGNHYKCCNEYRKSKGYGRTNKNG